MKFSINHSVRSICTISSKFIIVAASFLILTVGCVSNQQPNNESLWAAEQAIDNAERARVSQYAAAELMQAREILIRARISIEQKDMINAERFAQQAQVTAQLASARAELVKAQQINSEMELSISQLKQEMQRNQGSNL